MEEIDFDPRFGWLLLAGPSCLKVLMRWSGTNHPDNFVWQALNSLEGGACILVLIATGFWLGHWWAKDREQTLGQKLDKKLEERIDKALRKNSNEAHELYKKINHYEQDIKSLKEELELSHRKYHWLGIQYKELKSFTPRTAQDANQAALQAVTE
jgi:hypothetical protein